MPPQTLETKVESLEHRVTKLEELPGRIDELTVQVSQLGTRMDAECSAVRAEIRDVSSHARVLHEDVDSRLALVQHGQSTKPTQTRRSRKTL